MTGLGIGHEPKEITDRNRSGTLARRNLTAVCYSYRRRKTRVI
jgi:hypothetical protein